MKNLYTKLHSFQTEVGTIKKSAVNPFFKSHYVDINGIIDAIKPLLEKHGLVILQPLTEVNGKPAIMTTIADIETGESMNNTMPIPENSDAQKMGSAITYFRRYALQSLLLLEAEDDDGEGTKVQSTKHHPTSTQTAPKPTPKFLDPNEPPLPDFNAEFTAEDMAKIMDGEVVVKKGEPVAQVFPLFPDCPHENVKGSSYRKCYSCNLQRTVQS